MCIGLFETVANTAIGRVFFELGEMVGKVSIVGAFLELDWLRDQRGKFFYLFYFTNSWYVAKISSSAG
jgi:hypothetical protein